MLRFIGAERMVCRILGGGSQGVRHRGTERQTYRQSSHATMDVARGNGQSQSGSDDGSSPRNADSQQYVRVFEINQRLVVHTWFYKLDRAT